MATFSNISVHTISEDATRTYDQICERVKDVTLSDEHVKMLAQRAKRLFVLRTGIRAYGSDVMITLDSQDIMDLFDPL